MASNDRKDRVSTNHGMDHRTSCGEVEGPPPHNPPSVTGIWLSGPPVPHAAFIGTFGLAPRRSAVSPCSTVSPGFFNPSLSSPWSRVVSVPLPRGLPAPLAGLRCRGEGGVSSGVPRGPCGGGPIYYGLGVFYTKRS